MRINNLPEWAVTAILSGPIFGSDEGATGAAGGAASGNATGATGSGAITDPPANDPADDPKDNVNEEAAAAIRERDKIKAERDALAQEKQEREEAEAAAQAATRSKEENLEAQVQTLTQDNQALAAVNEANILKISVLENQKYQWIDPTDVIKLLDKSEIKIDAKKGIAEGVEDALKSLAKAKPHLLKPSADNEGNSGNGNGAPAGPPISGGMPSGGGNANSKDQKRKAMKERFGSVLGI